MHTLVCFCPLLCNGFDMCSCLGAVVSCIYQQDGYKVGMFECVMQLWKGQESPSTPKRPLIEERAMIIQLVALLSVSTLLSSMMSSKASEVNLQSSRSAVLAG